MTLYFILVSRLALLFSDSFKALGKTGPVSAGLAKGDSGVEEGSWAWAFVGHSVCLPTLILSFRTR